MGSGEGGEVRMRGQRALSNEFFSVDVGHFQLFSAQTLG